MVSNHLPPMVQLAFLNLIQVTLIHFRCYCLFLKYVFLKGLSLASTSIASFQFAFHVTTGPVKIVDIKYLAKTGVWCCLGIMGILGTTATLHNLAAHCRSSALRPGHMAQIDLVDARIQNHVGRLKILEYFSKKRSSYKFWSDGLEIIIEERSLISGSIVVQRRWINYKN